MQAAEQIKPRSQLKFVRKTDLLCLSGILTVFFSALILSQTTGEFPLNDDWTYAFSAMKLADQGKLDIHAFNQAAATSHILWGALVCKVFGSSFQVLHLSTTLLATVALIGFYISLRLISNAPLAVIATLSLATNPIFLQLSCTYMTDVPFVALITLSNVCFTISTQTKSRKWINAAYALAFVACLNRQLGLIWVLSMSLALSLPQLKRKEIPTFAILGSATCIVGSLAVSQVLQLLGVTPSQFTLAQIVHDFFTMLRNPITTIVPLLLRYFLFLCWFAAPLVCLQVINWQSRLNQTVWAALVLTIFVILRQISPAELTFGNMIGPAGLGPFTLRDTLGLNQNSLPSLPDLYFDFGRFFAAISASFITIKFVEIFRRDKKARYLIAVSILALALNWYLTSNIEIWTKYLGPAISVTLELGLVMYGCCGGLRNIATVNEADTRLSDANCMFAGIYMFVLTNGVPFSFDRYLLPIFLPLSLVLVANFKGAISKQAMAFALSIIVLNLLFSVGAVHDYFAWNRTRWNLLSELTTQQKIPANKIDGGYEFNGTFLYDDNYKVVPEKSFYWVDKDDYVLSFSELPGYTVLNRYPFGRWLFKPDGTIFELRRK